MVLRQSPLDDEVLRVRLVMAFMLAVFLLLGGALWRVQVAHTEKYGINQEKQSVRRVRLPGVRGRLMDRHGEIMADNRPSYCVAIYLEELRQPGSWSKTIDKVESVITELTNVLGVPPVVSRDEIRAHIKRRLPLPLIAWRDLDDQTLARLAEQGSLIPGVDIYTEAVRYYPMRRVACHVLGYVGKANEQAQEEEEAYHYNLPEMAGRSGLERAFDEVLRGQAGGRLMRIDVTGYRRHDIDHREPQRGSDLILALDAQVQKLAESALAETPGAVVVMDPRNGDVLAMASSPAFDPNNFIPFIRSQDWETLTADPDKPLMNRCTAGAYPPGSIFKPVTAMASLENGKSTPDTSFECPGYFQLGNKVMRCWQHSGHGLLNLRQGLEKSCNVYFFRLAMQSGPEYVQNMARALGLGRKTGIDLDYEVAGLVPDAAWKRRVQQDGWRDGDTCNMAIGQGALLVTPLQMAVMASALANSGHVYRPRLVLGTRRGDEAPMEEHAPEIVNEMNWSRQNIQAVREGMRAVVMNLGGTGQRAAVPGITMAAKTGTAEFGLKTERHRHAWMIAFAPYEEPRYAVAMVVDEGTSGGETAGPRMKNIMAGLFKLEKVSGGGSG